MLVRRGHLTSSDARRGRLNKLSVAGLRPAHQDFVGSPGLAHGREGSGPLTAKQDRYRYTATAEDVVLFYEQVSEYCRRFVVRAARRFRYYSRWRHFRYYSRWRHSPRRLQSPPETRPRVAKLTLLCFKGRVMTRSRPHQVVRMCARWASQGNTIIAINFCCHPLLLRHRVPSTPAGPQNAFPSAMFILGRRAHCRLHARSLEPRPHHVRLGLGSTRCSRPPSADQRGG